MRNDITLPSHGPVLECKHSARVCLAYVSPSENSFIDSLLTFKLQANINSINICYFDWRTFKLDAFNPDLILTCIALPY